MYCALLQPIEPPELVNDRREAPQLQPAEAADDCTRPVPPEVAHDDHRVPPGVQHHVEGVENKLLWDTLAINVHLTTGDLNKLDALVVEELGEDVRGLIGREVDDSLQMKRLEEREVELVGDRAPVKVRLDVAEVLRWN